MRLILFLLFLPIVTFSQSSKKQDERIGIMAITKDDATLRESDAYCNSSYKDLPNKSIVFVCGARTSCGALSIGGFYKILYRGNPYVIDTSEVYILRNIYDSIVALDQDGTDTLFAKAKYSDSLYQLVQNAQLQLEIDQSKKYGLIITDWGLFDVSEYTDGTGISFEIYNTALKTIKYITFNVIAYNPVKDKVYSSKFRNYTVSLKGVGPIKPSAGGKYSWDYVWFSDLPETAKIISIQIQYIDGTFKTVTDIKKITLSKAASEYLLSTE